MTDAIWQVSGSTVSIVDQIEFTSIPNELSQFADVCTELTITFCSLKSVSNLDKFQKLKMLNCDNNLIEDENYFPHIGTLETLCLNSNKITRLSYLVNQIENSFPNLKYLSLLKNPCCPNYLVGKGNEDYKKYRSTVLGALPRLKFLDSSPVTNEEREAAITKYKSIKRADESEYLKKAEKSAVSEENSLSKVEMLPDTGSSFTKTKFTSYGRSSQGNRFITDI